MITIHLYDNVHILSLYFRSSKTSSKAFEWADVVASVEKRSVQATAVSRGAKRKLNLGEVPSLGDEVIIDTPKQEVGI